VFEFGAKAWIMLGISLVLFLMLEILARAFYRPDAKVIGIGETDPRALSEAYKGADWSKDYYRELAESDHARWESYVYWRKHPFSGKYINVDTNGYRKTVNMFDSTGDVVRIYFLGGSFMWGTGTRDEYTVPSLFAKKLAERGYRKFHVINMAETGYVSTQEYIKLFLELRAGRVPSIVIFADGVNDLYSAAQNREVGIPENEANRRSEFNRKRGRGHQSAGQCLMSNLRLARLVRDIKSGTVGAKKILHSRGIARPILPHGQELSYADDVIRIYAHNCAAVEDLAKKWDFECFFFWQPSVFLKKTRSAEEVQSSAINGDLESYFKTAYGQLASGSCTNLPANFVNMQQLFDDHPETIFVDFCHTGEQGSEMFADKVLQVVTERSRILK